MRCHGHSLQSGNASVLYKIQLIVVVLGIVRC